MNQRMLRQGSALLLALVVALGCPNAIRAQETDSELRVAVNLLPPFVMKQEDHLTGFSIELWEAIAAKLKIKAVYQIVPDLGTLIETVRSDNADVGVSGVFYTAERDKVIDYTYSIMNVGQQVMVLSTGAGITFNPFRDFLSLLFSWSALLWLGAALVVILIPAHMVWLLDRRNEDGPIAAPGYFPGIFHAMVWATTALVSQVQVMPRQWFARWFGLIWMFAGVVFISLYTAQLTALLTVEEIRGAINGPADLPGKRVGTMSHTVSAEYLREINAEAQEFSSADEMYQALLDGKVDALVMGAATLNYFAAHEGMGRVKLVGPEIQKDDVGFIVQLGSPLRKRISNQLLALREDGTYQEIYAKWFGGD